MEKKLVSKIIEIVTDEIDVEKELKLNNKIRLENMDYDINCLLMHHQDIVSKFIDEFNEHVSFYDDLLVKEQFNQEKKQNHIKSILKSQSFT